MKIDNLKLNNFTVFSELDISFSEGINIFIGENGTGKTHIMKLLYSGCQAGHREVNFAEKIVKVFRPDNLNINRLVSTKEKQKMTSVQIGSKKSKISTKFDFQTNKWNAETSEETGWEDENNDLISTFIPSKEILANAFQFEAAYLKRVIDFDETYLDIVTAAKIDIRKDENNKLNQNRLDKLMKVLGGQVEINAEKFYLKPENQDKIEFHLIAEGLRKIALLWQLIKNGTLESGSILFWDEPEANLNPQVIPIIVEILLELQKNGVQIFIATHDYMFAKYFEIKANETDSINYYSLYKNNNQTVEINTCNNFRDLKNNPIIEAYDILLDEVLEKNMGD